MISGHDAAVSTKTLCVSTKVACHSERRVVSRAQAVHYGREKCLEIIGLIESIPDRDAEMVDRIAALLTLNGYTSAARIVAHHPGVIEDGRYQAGGIWRHVAISTTRQARALISASRFRKANVRAPLWNIDVGREFDIIHRPRN